MNRKIIATMLVSIACIAAAAGICADSLWGDTEVTVVADDYIDESSGITFTLYSDNTATAKKQSGAIIDLAIPGTVSYNGGSYTVTKIGSTFASSSLLTSVRIPASVKVIEDDASNYKSYGAFNGSQLLKSVTFDEGSAIERIGTNAFRGCVSLASINLPEGLKELGDNAFGTSSSSTWVSGSGSVRYTLGCYSLKEIELPASLEKLGDSVFTPVPITLSVADGNNHFVVEDGILYDKEKTTVIRASNISGDIVISDTVTKVSTYAFNFLQKSDIPDALLGSRFFKLDYNPITEPSANSITFKGTMEFGTYAFSNAIYIDSVVVEKPVASVGRGAFSGCTALKEIIIGGTATVATNAFSNCTGLTSVKIESGAKLENQAFMDCSGITELVISKNVSIGMLAFNGCNALVTLEIPENVTLGSQAFYNCTHIANLKIGNNVTVGNNAFSKCTSITTLTILGTENVGLSGTSVQKLILSENIISIGNFSSSTKLTTITYVGQEDVPEGTVQLPATLRTISDGAFKGCTSLASVTLPYSVTSVGSGAFSGCTALSSVTFNSDISVVKDDSFSGCTALTKTNEIGLSYVEISKGETFYRYVSAFEPADGWDGTLTIDGTIRTITGDIIHGKGVKALVVDGSDLFSADDTMLYDKSKTAILYVLSTASGSITIPSTVKEILSYAFSDVSNEFTILFNNGTQFTTISDYAFAGSGITRFNVPSTLSSIGSYAFKDTSMSSFDISGADITNLGDNSFRDSGLTTFTPSNKLVSIGKSAFYGTKLSSFTAPSSLTTIGSNAFDGSSVSVVDLSATGDLKIGSSAFTECSSLTSIKFSSSSTYTIESDSIKKTAIETLELMKGTIGSYAFQNCLSLTSVHIGSGVTSIAYNTFKGCTSLETVWIESSSTFNNNIMDSLTGLNYIVPYDKVSVYQAFKSAETVRGSIDLPGGNHIYLPITDGVTYSVVSSENNTAVVSIKPASGYSASSIAVTLDGETITSSGDFKYSLTASKQISELGVSVDREIFTITFQCDNGSIKVFDRDSSEIYAVRSDESIYFSVDPNEGYTFSELSAKLGETTYSPFHTNEFVIPATQSGAIVISGLADDTVTVTLVGNTTTTKQVLRGTTIAGVTGDWYTMDSNDPFDMSQTVSKDITLYSSPVDGSKKAVVDFYASRGTMTATIDGATIEDDSIVLKGTSVTFTYDGGNNYEVKGWYVNGVYTEDSSYSKTVSVFADISVTVSVSYFQSGYEYIIDSPLPISSEDVESMLWIGDYNDPLSSSYSANMPAGYLSVGDYLFYSSGNMIYRIDLNSDFSGGQQGNRISVDLGSSAGTLCYANGYLFDCASGKILTTDLEIVGTTGLALSNIYAYGTDFIGTSTKMHVRFSLTENEDGTVKYTKKWSQTLSMKYGKDFIDGDYLYYMPISSSSDKPERSFASLDLRTGKVKDTISLDEWIYGHYLDDAWVTVYDGWIYICSYTSGLFAETNPYVKDNNPKILRVAVEDGEFVDGTVQTIITTDNNYQKSGLVVYRDRGYMQSGSTLYVLDMTTFSIIYTINGERTHGGIVVDTYYATEANNWTVYIYVVPYGNSQHIVIYEDKVGQTEGKVITLEDMGYKQYATTHIQASASGYMYWYNDSSIFFIYGSQKHTVEFISDGEVVSTTSMKNGATIALPADPVKEGFKFAGWYNYDGTLISSGSTVNGAMTISAMWTVDYIEATTAEEDGMTIVDVDVLANPNLDDAYVLMVAEYSNIRIWSFQKVVWTEDGTADCKFSTSSAGLSKVSVSLVNGDSTKDIMSYGRWTAEM